MFGQVAEKWQLPVPPRAERKSSVFLSKNAGMLRFAQHDNFAFSLRSLDARRDGSFLYLENLSHRQVVKGVHPSAGPSHIERVHDFCRAEAEVHPQIALRKEAAAASYLVDLGVMRGHAGETRADGTAIGLGPDELDLDPVIVVHPVAAQQRRGIIH